MADEKEKAAKRQSTPSNLSACDAAMADCHTPNREQKIANNYAGQYVH